MRIGEAIREVRHLKGWTQSQLARMAGLSVGTIKMVEFQGKNPRLFTVLKITDALGVTVEQLALICTTKPDGV